jgi:hypothetical protein
MSGHQVGLDQLKEAQEGKQQITEVLVLLVLL